MKKTNFVYMIISLIIIGILTNCSSTPKPISEPEPAPEQITINSTDIMWVYGKDIFKINDTRYDLYRIKSNTEYENIGDRLMTGGPFTLHFIPKISRDSNASFPIIKIDGLMSIGEFNIYEAQRKEAERLADEDANRYDPSKFTIVPNNFKPANYTSIDLFDAVARVERVAYLMSSFVSEVVFVNQNGTDILFGTADNAISQNMKVNARSGLTAGQRIRLYYSVIKNTDPRYNLLEWNVIAIEQL